MARLTRQSTKASSEMPSSCRDTGEIADLSIPLGNLVNRSAAYRSRLSKGTKFFSAP